jgi:hypothetical protein
MPTRVSAVHHSNSVCLTRRNVVPSGLISILGNIHPMLCTSANISVGLQPRNASYARPMRRLRSVSVQRDLALRPPAWSAHLADRYETQASITRGTAIAGGASAAAGDFSLRRRQYGPRIARIPTSAFRAHLLQIRVQALNDDLHATFKHWYPDLRHQQKEKLAA